MKSRIPARGLVLSGVVALLLVAGVGFLRLHGGQVHPEPGDSAVATGRDSDSREVADRDEEGEREAGELAPKGGERKRTTAPYPAPLQRLAGKRGILVSQDVKHDKSRPLRNLPVIKPSPKAPEEENGRDEAQIPVRNHKNEPDHALQQSLHPDAPVANMPATSANFDGMSNATAACNCLPPDTNGDVGPNHYVETVNVAFQVFNKSGTSLYGPAAINTIWQGFGGPCQVENSGDPVVLYDQLADRWVITQFAVDAAPYYECIAVSVTGDPTGAYYRYAFQTSTTSFPDYPKFGVWRDGYYMSTVEFANAQYYAGPQPYAFDRDAMLAGQPATFQTPGALGSSYPLILPADMDGNVAPDAGSPEYFAGADSGLRVSRFHVDWANPASTTFTTAVNLTVAGWTQLCPSTRACVPQSGTTSRLDGIGDRLMNRLAYRRVDGIESLVLNRTVDAGGGVAGVRWYELRNLTTTPVIYQQSTFAPGIGSDNISRWMGSIAMDVAGNVGLGYSVSNGAMFPAIRYTGRLASDPINAMTQGEGTVVNGTGSQTSTSSRWGDYTSMSVDPVDDCTFWYAGEYYSATSSAGWKTRIGSFKFPSCTLRPIGGLQGSVTDNSNGQAVPLPLIEVVSGPGYRKAAGDASGSYYLRDLPAGSYSIRASAYGYNPATADVGVAANGIAALNFVLAPLPHHTLSGHVYDVRGNPAPNVSVSLPGARLPATTTDGTGAYSFYAFGGSYTVTAKGSNCVGGASQGVTLDSDQTVDLRLGAADASGHFCETRAASYLNGDTAIPTPGNGDDAVATVTLPFNVPFYGQSYGTAYMSTNGNLRFLSSTASDYTNTGIPNAAAPNAAIYPLWDDLKMDASSSLWSATLGTAPNRRFVLEWRNMLFYGTTTRVSLEVVLYENGQILLQYSGIGTDGRQQGNSATVGIENESGTQAVQYSLNQAVLSNGAAILFRTIDTTLPTVALTAPADGAHVRGTVGLTANASDNELLDHVDFYVDTDKVATDSDGSDGYGASVDTTALSDGTHNLKATAVDGFHNTADDTRTVVMDNAKPTGSIRINGGTQYTNTANVTLGLTAVDNLSGVQRMQLSDDGTTWGAPVDYAATASYTLPASDGAKTVYVRYIDGAGNVSDPYRASITLDTANPTAALTAPANGAYVRGSVTLAATATDNTAVSSVQFLVNGVAVGAADTVAPYSVAWNTAGINGARTITARATDRAGNVATSAPVTVAVDNTAPTVSLTAPVAGAVVRGSVTLSATAGDNNAVRGVQFLVNGAAVGAEDTTSPYGVVWNTTGINGSRTITARVVDRAGNVTTSAAVTVTVDNTAPTTLTAPVRTAYNPPALGADAAPAPVKLSWCATGCSTDIAAYDLQQRKLSGTVWGAWGNVLTNSALKTTTRSLAPGTYGFQLRARDAAGNYTAWKAMASSIVVTAYDEANTAIGYTGTWSAPTALTGSYLTKVKSSSAAGSRARVTFTGGSFWWVSSKYKDRGKANVYEVSGTTRTLLGTVDLYANTTSAQARRVVFARNWTTVGTHTLEIEVLSTKNAASTGYRVDVDAFVALR